MTRVLSGPPVFRSLRSCKCFSAFKDHSTALYSYCRPTPGSSLDLRIFVGNATDLSDLSPGNHSLPISGSRFPSTSSSTSNFPFNLLHPSSSKKHSGLEIPSSGSPAYRPPVIDAQNANDCSSRSYANIFLPKRAA